MCQYFILDVGCIQICTDIKESTEGETGCDAAVHTETSQGTNQVLGTTMEEE